MKNSKNKNYAFRISERDLEEIKRKAKCANLTVTDYITKSALDKEIIVIEGLPQMVMELKAIGRNLNQLTVLTNMEKLQVLSLDDVAEQIGNIYSELRRALEVL